MSRHFLAPLIGFGGHRPLGFKRRRGTSMPTPPPSLPPPPLFKYFPCCLYVVSVSCRLPSPPCALTSVLIFFVRYAAKQPLHHSTLALFVEDLENNYGWMICGWEVLHRCCCCCYCYCCCCYSCSFSSPSCLHTVEDFPSQPHMYTLTSVVCFSLQETPSLVTGQLPH